jgi:ABC-type phosphate transport system substrate-binding protein
MKTPTLTVALLGLCSFAPALASQSQPKAGDALAIIVNRSNPVAELSMRELRRIFLFDTQTWSSGRKITVVLRERGQPERGLAIRLICDMSEREYDRHVLYQTFRGTIAQGPREIRSASAMLRFVFNAPGAIGYVRAAETTDATKVLRIDGLLPADARYPLRLRPQQDAAVRR